MKKHDYDYTPLYYGTPCPVKYYYKGQFLYGVGFQEYIFNATEKISIEEIISAARADGIFWDDAIVERG